MMTELPLDCLWLSRILTNWVLWLGQQLSAIKEHGNAEDRLAVAAIKHRDGGAGDTDVIPLFGCQTALIRQTSNTSNLMCLLINTK